MSDKEKLVKAEFNFDNPKEVGVRVNAVVEVAKINFANNLISFNRDFTTIPKEVLQQIVTNWDVNEKTAKNLEKEKKEDK